MDGEWIRVGNVADIDEDDTHPVEIDGRRVCLYNLGGEIFATDGTCTHGDADLSLGMVVDSCLMGSPRFQCNNWRYANPALARGWCW
jgi:nitrite reductase/ring-hydroxylating ferredoxin subunit